MTNIYKVNEYDWVAAESLNDAAVFYREYTGEEIDHEEAYELWGGDLDQLQFNADDGAYGLADGKHSFRVALAAALAAGWTPPFLFASTEQ